MTTDEIEYAPQQEVRLAVVLYGGVSLAIYMYGVAEELYRWSAPRARATVRRPGGQAGRPRVRRSREHGDGLPRAGAATAVEQGDDDALGPVRTRFVVDILSGPRPAASTASAWRRR